MTKPGTEKTEKPQDKSSETNRSDEIRDETLENVSGGRRTRPSSSM